VEIDNNKTGAVREQEVAFGGGKWVDTETRGAADLEVSSYLQRN